MPKHLISVDQFDRSSIEQLFREADHLRDLPPEILHERKRNKRLATLFYEPSTRTRMSFEAAAMALGMGVLSSENAKQFSSAAKGETIEDTVRVVGCYAHGIVIRHDVTGSVAAAAEVSQVPIINAGDGAGEHPTQALLDLYTIQRELGRLDNLNIMMVGDLLYGRTVHSLTRILKHFEDINIFFVSPEVLGMPPEVLDEIPNITHGSYDNLGILDTAIDVLYVTRIQKERFPTEAEYKKYDGIYNINKHTLYNMKQDSIILHPLPRVNEIDPEIDDDPRAAYFRQAENGLYIRMSILNQLID